MSKQPGLAIDVRADVEAALRGFAQLRESLEKLRNLGANFSRSISGGAQQVRDSLKSVGATARDVRNSLGGVAAESRSLAGASRDIGKLGEALKRVNKEGSAVVGGVRGIGRELKQLVAGYLTLRGAVGLAKLSDQVTVLAGRVRMASGDMQKLVDVANGTRAGLDATVDLYARIERSTRDRALGEERLLGLTTAVQQAVKLSYTDASSAAGAIFQFGQALAAGRLSGDELNSVLEGTPRLAEAIANGMGKTTSELKALGKQGKLTTSEIIAALEKEAPRLAEEFAQMPVTIGDAFTVARNNVLKFVSDMNEGSGAAQAFSTFLMDMARGLPALFKPLVEAIGQVVHAFQDASVSADGTTGALGRTADVAETLSSIGSGLATVFRVLVAVFAVVKNVVEVATTAFAAQVETVIVLAKTIKDHLTTAFAAFSKAWAAVRSGDIGGALEAMNEGLAGIRGQAAAAGRSLVGLAVAAGEMHRQNLGEIGVAWAAAFSGVSPAAKKAAAAGSGGVGSQPPGAAAGGGTGKGSGAVAGIINEQELALDAIARKVKELDVLWKAGAKGLGDYYREKEALELARIDVELNRARAEAASAKSSDQQSRALTQIVKLERDRADVVAAIAREKQEAEAAQEKTLAAMRHRLMSAQGQEMQVHQEQLQAEMAEWLEKLPADAKAAGQAIVDQLMPLELARARREAVQAEVEKISAALQSRTASLAAQQQVGAITAIEAQRRLYEAQQASLEKWRKQQQALQAFLATLSRDNPEYQKTVQALEALGIEIAKVESEQQQFKNSLKNEAESAAVGFFESLITGAKSFKDAFADMVKSFLAGIAKMIAQELALKAIGGIFSRNTGGGTAAAVHHTGGIVRASGGVRRWVSPMLFGQAPRYHGGGIAGLRPGEVPAILMAGEEVLTRRDPRHRANLNVGTGGVTVQHRTIVNNYSSAKVEERTESRRQPDGRVLQDTVISIVEDSLNGGRLARFGQARYGWRAQV